MNLIKIMKECTKEQLQKRGFEFRKVSDWVSISFEEDEEEYETNRYDVSFEDELSIYIYFNEDCNYIYAIDDITQDLHKDARYMMVETPIYREIKSLNLL